MLQFPVREETGKIRRAMPCNSKPVDENIISLTISELVEWEIARGSDY
jgi:hypothetical protein